MVRTGVPVLTGVAVGVAAAVLLGRLATTLLLGWPPQIP